MAVVINRNSRRTIFIAVVNLCALVEPGVGRAAGRLVDRFSHLEKDSLFVGTVQIKNSI